MLNIFSFGRISKLSGPFFTQLLCDPRKHYTSAFELMNKVIFPTVYFSSYSWVRLDALCGGLSGGIFHSVGIRH